MENTSGITGSVAGNAAGNLFGNYLFITLLLTDEPLYFLIFYVKEESCYGVLTKRFL
jgi:hypothetical protein